VIALGTLIRFWSYRKWVWLVHQTGAPAVVDDQPGGTPAGEAGYPGAGQLSDPAAGNVNGNGYSAGRATSDPLPRRPTWDMTGPGAPRTGR
jgi:hypothetical protein